MLERAACRTVRPVPEVLVFRTADAPPGVLEAARRLCDDAFAGAPDGEFGDDDWDHALGGWHVFVLDDPPSDDGTGRHRDLPEHGGATAPDGARRVVAHAAVVERTLHVAGTPFRTGYVEAVATRPGRHGEGLGSLAMVEIGRIIRRDFELGALGTGRWSFYERMGWTVVSALFEIPTAGPHVRMAKRLG